MLTQTYVQILCAYFLHQKNEKGTSFLAENY